MAPNIAALLRRWWIFLRERHDPIGITLMVLAFFAANGFMAKPVGQPWGLFPAPAQLADKSSHIHFESAADSESAAVSGSGSDTKSDTKSGAKPDSKSDTVSCFAVDSATDFATESGSDNGPVCFGFSSDADADADADAVADVGSARFAADASGHFSVPSVWQLFGGFAVIWLVFLHMRMFDEVKDYQVDLEHHPERPLARGVISLLEFGVGTMLVLLLEFRIAVGLGWAAFYAYALLLCFTLLMRMEFFIGDWMRPKLELYAITHTFSAVVMGVFILVVVSGRGLSHASSYGLAFALGNWFVFNVFEFGRKTFAAEEERSGVDSYSGRLRPWGAVALLLGNVFFAFALLWLALLWKYGAAERAVLIPAAFVAGLTMIAGVLYALQPGVRFAKLYRGCVTLYLLLYHVAIAGGLYVLGR